MNHPILRINAVHKLPANPPTVTATKTRIAPLSVAFAALLCLLGFASATTPASAQAVNFGSINVCPAGATTPSPCNATQTVTFSIPAGTTIGSIAILTTGVPDLDFKAKADDTSTTLCKAKTYTSATTCTVDVTFAPIGPGQRKGAVELLNGSGSLIGTTYVYGIGVSPQIVYGTPTLQELAPRVRGIIISTAVDASGNIFADFYNNANTLSGGVQEFLAADNYTTGKTIYSGDPGAVIALDGAGDIFMVGGPTTIVELVAAQGYAPKTIKYDATETLSGSLAVDASGNLFVTVGSPDIEVRELLAASNYTTAVTVASGFHQEDSRVDPLVVDPAGNVFLADYDSGAKTYRIKEVLAAGGYTTVNTIASNKYGLSVVGVDAGDNLYFDQSTLDFNGLYEARAAGGYTDIHVVRIGSSSFSGYEASLGNDGNLYTLPGGINDNVSPIYELVRSQPPDFAFAATGVGGVSATQSTTLQNIGNAALTGSLSLTDATNFSLVPDSGNPPDCTDSLSLVPSADCNVSVAFTPQSAESLTGSVVFTDNALNATGATQSIALSGTGVATTVLVSPAVLDFGSIPYTETATQTLTITNTGTTTLTIDPSSDGRGAVITGSTCGAGVGAGKSCTLQVEFKPVAVGLNHNTITIQTNAGRNPTVPVRGTATGVGSVSTVLSFGSVGSGSTATGYIYVDNVGVPGNVTVATETGATTFHVTENTCTTGVGAGSSCAIVVEFAPVSTGPETAYLKLIPSTGPEQIIVMTGNLVP